MMTEEMKEAVDTAPVVEGKTADQLLQDIEQAQRELKASAPAKVEAPEPTEPQKGDRVEPDMADKPTETVEASEPTEEVSVPEGKDKADEIDEWMQKKGFKSKEDMARSLRNLERELHRRGKVVQQEQIAPVPMAPPPQFYPQNSPSTIPNAGLQQIADHYQMAPEDVQRVAPLAQDIADYMLRQRLGPLVEDFSRLKRDYQKEAEFKKLENDPIFQNREVLKEMHLLAEENPSILDQPDYPKVLFDESLKRIGRRFAESSTTPQNVHGLARLGIPSSPPPTGKGSSGEPKGVPLKPPSSSLTINKFNKLSSAEMEQELRKKGAFKGIHE
jgi:hypothetical protein